MGREEESEGEEDATAELSSAATEARASSAEAQLRGATALRSSCSHSEPGSAAASARASAATMLGGDRKRLVAGEEPLSFSSRPDSRSTPAALIFAACSFRGRMATRCSTTELSHGSRDLSSRLGRELVSVMAGPRGSEAWKEKRPDGMEASARCVFA